MYFLLFPFYFLAVTVGVPICMVLKKKGAFNVKCFRFESNNNWLLHHKYQQHKCEKCKMDKLITLILVYPSSIVLLARRDALMSGQFHPAQQVQKSQDEVRNANVADMGRTQTS